MQVDLVELGDAVDFLDSKRVPVREELRKPGPYPYYGANGQQGRIDGYIFDEPLVLLAEDGGHFGSKEKPIAYYVEGKCWVNNHAHVMRTRQGCDAHYLHHILSYYDVSPYVTGSTRPKLTKGNAESIKIPLRPLSEQKRIAVLLEKADRLRRTRRYARQLSDTFLQSVFVEMFGDPVRNVKGWSRESLTELGRIVTGSTPPSAKAGMFGEGVPFVTPGDLEVDTLKTNRFLTDAGAKHSRLVRKGSTLVCCIGATIGKTDQARTLSAFNQQINAVEWKPIIDDSYGLFLMKFFSKEVAAKGRSTTLPILKKSAFEEIPVPIPPLPLQQKFADIVRRFERLCAQQREAERQAEHLFQTLLHRAFNGEL